VTLLHQTPNGPWYPWLNQKVSLLFEINYICVWQLSGVVDRVVGSREIKTSFWRNGESNVPRFVKNDEKKQRRDARQRLKVKKARKI